MTIGIDGVEVEFCRSSKDWRQTAIMVKVRSRRKKQVKKTVEVHTDEAGTSSKLIQMIGIAAAAAAEALCTEYGDDFDLSMIQAAAVRAFGEECRLYAEVGKGASAIIKRLHEHRNKMPDELAEKVDRWLWLVNSPTGKLTPADVREAQALIAFIHREQL
jgi:hypothetical protein